MSLSDKILPQTVTLSSSIILPYDFIVPLNIDPFPILTSLVNTTLSGSVVSGGTIVSDFRVKIDVFRNNFTGCCDQFVFYMLSMDLL